METSLADSKKPRISGAKRRQLKRCEEKTSKGNVFDTEENAGFAARNMRRKTGEWIRFYTCHHCGKYHIGRGNKVAQYGMIEK